MPGECVCVCVCVCVVQLREGTYGKDDALRGTTNSSSLDEREPGGGAVACAHKHKSSTRLRRRRLRPRRPPAGSPCVIFFVSLPVFDEEDANARYIPCTQHADRLRHKHRCRHRHRHTLEDAATYMARDCKVSMLSNQASQNLCTRKHHQHHPHARAHARTQTCARAHP